MENPNQTASEPKPQTVIMSEFSFKVVVEMIVRKAGLAREVQGHLSKQIREDGAKIANLEDRINELVKERDAHLQQIWQKRSECQTLERKIKRGKKS